MAILPDMPHGSVCLIAPVPRIIERDGIGRIACQRCGPSHPAEAARVHLDGVEAMLPVKPDLISEVINEQRVRRIHERPMSIVTYENDAIQSTERSALMEDAFEGAIDSVRVDIREQIIQVRRRAFINIDLGGEPIVGMMNEVWDLFPNFIFAVWSLLIGRNERRIDFWKVRKWAGTDDGGSKEHAGIGRRAEDCSIARIEFLEVHHTTVE